MRQAQVFPGSSHPALVEGICERLGLKTGKAELTKFSNGETSVQILSSVRDQDVFIVQSGSDHTNDNLVELLIMISACKGGSAKSITAVLPYFPYCRQSKKKSHRGAITARMVANLLHVAGVTHIITVDLHATQMQGFFQCPVDNLRAEPQIARWIRQNITDWREAVVVSKNPGGTKRVTSLADALKLSFGMVTTDRRRYFGAQSLSEHYNMMGSSMILDSLADGMSVTGIDGTNEETKFNNGTPVSTGSNQHEGEEGTPDGMLTPTLTRDGKPQPDPMALHGTDTLGLVTTQTQPTPDASETLPPVDLRRSRTEPANIGSDLDEEFTDERAKDVTIGRLIHGHIVDEDQSSPSLSAYSSAGAHRNPRVTSNGGFDGHGGSPGQGGSGQTGSSENGDAPEHMASSFISTTSSFRTQSVIGGTMDAGIISEEEEEEELEDGVETTVTLVGNVRDRPVFLVDDMIDKAGSWIAAAETVVKRGGATRVYCFATHGLFGGRALEELEECEQVSKVVVTNSFPISPERTAKSSKLVMLDMSTLLAEAIRRNKFGESMDALYSHFD